MLDTCSYITLHVNQVELCMYSANLIPNFSDISKPSFMKIQKMSFQKLSLSTCCAILHSAQKTLTLLLTRQCMEPAVSSLMVV